MSEANDVTIEGSKAKNDADEYNRKKDIIKKVPVFRHLSQEQTDKVIAALVPRNYTKGTAVCTQGELGNTFFVIAEGELTVTINGNLIRTQGRNGSIGERALLFDEPRSATVKVSSDGAELWCLNKETFDSIVTGKMQKDLMYRINLQDAKVELADLRPIRVIGTGAFAVVRLVEHRKTKVQYALKSLKKENGQMPAEMKNEMEILAENENPFVLFVVKTFETKSRVTMLTELVQGGDLYALIRTIPTVLSKKQVQFYASGALIGLTALWDRRVIYRDLKPENIMIDSLGYPKIIDFGISKKLGADQDKTFTMVGTPHYMAPDVMRGNGYGVEVDLWCLGAMMYEFVCGQLPFADESDDNVVICTAILTETLTFPDQYKDVEGRALITALMTRNPKKRLGTGSRISEVRCHSYFSINPSNPEELFDKMMGRELQPPIPQKGDAYCSDEEAAAATLSDADELWPTTKESNSKTADTVVVQLDTNADPKGGCCTLL